MASVGLLRAALVALAVVTAVLLLLAALFPLAAIAAVKREWGLFAVFLIGDLLAYAAIAKWGSKG